MAFDPPTDPPPQAPAGQDPPGATARPDGDPEAMPPESPAVSAAAPPAPRLPAPGNAPAWGPIATVALSLGVLVVYSILQGVLALFALVGGPQTLPPISASDALPPLPNAGLLFAVGTIVAAPLGIAMIWMLARARRGLPVGGYLGLRRPAWRDVLLGAALLVLYSVAYDVLSTRLGRPDVPDFMVEAFRTAVFLPVLWAAVVLAAPAFEELLFRGFLIEGLRRSPAGAVGAALGSSLLFALIHLQYDLFDMSAIFGLGLLFAVMRLKSGSTWLTLGLHALTNLISMVQVSLHLRGG